MTIPQALVKLSRSKFRGRFKLKSEMVELAHEKGLEEIRKFAADRIRTALAPAEPTNDGKQTPMKGHPVFIAQHATATCCRTCLNHWWRVKEGVVMTELQQQKAVNLIMAWIEMQMSGGVEALEKIMSEEELAGIPFWQSVKYECPYRVDKKCD